MATNIKITALSDITSANMTYNDLVAVVDMNGTAETKKSSVQLVGNLILGGAGGSNFVNAAVATLAGDVTNAAQANITSVGTLTSATVTGNVDAGNVNATTAVVATYFAGDGANLTNLPSGSNSAAIANGTSNVDIPAVDGNINISSAGNANIAIVTGTGVNVTGTLNATGVITGDGSGLSAIAGANVSGAVALATDATTANAVALANVSGAGNIASINIDGAVGNILYGNGVFAPAGAGSNSAAIANGTSNINIATADGSATIGIGGVGDIVTVSGTAVTVVGGVAATYVSGDGANLTALAGANVTGAVPFASVANSVAGANVSGTVALATLATDATTANAVAGANVAGAVTFAGTANAMAGANVTGEVTFAATANAVAGANVSGEVAFAATANAVAGANVSGTINLATFATTANAVAYANVSGTPTLGNISTINIDGSASTVLYGNGAFAAITATTAGTVTSAAQPNITSTGTLTSLTVNGALGVTGSGVITGDGGGISNIAVGNLVGTVNLATFAGTANAVAGANVSGEVTFAGTANAVAGANVSGEVTFAATANAVAGANVSGTVTTATNAVQVAITDDTSTAATHYVNFTAATSGNEPVKVSSTKATFNPSTGDLTASGTVQGAVATGTSYLKTTPVTVASLPAAGTAGSGARAMVTDADNFVFNASLSGGGGNIMPVFSNGTDWRIG